MFSVLSANSLHKLNRKKLNRINAAPQPSFVTHTTKISKIVGANARSRSGCSFCKKRRRKCDEAHPICGLCSQKGADCVYEHKSEKKRRRDGTNEQKVIDLRTDEERCLTPTTTAMDLYDKKSNLTSTPQQNLTDKNPASTNTRQSRMKQAQSPTNTVSNQLTISQIKSNPINLEVIDPVFYTTPQSPLSLFLGEDERFYIDYFQKHVTNQLCLSSTNYFSKLFCLLANNEEAFALSISAWGALYYKRKKLDNQVSNYLYRSVVKFSQTFESDDNNLGCYFKICYYLILVGFNICTGDRKNWKQFLVACNASINKIGGLKKLAEAFHYSDEVRFLVSNFQYHDIMSSNGNGTLVPMEEYKAVFNCEQFVARELAYGIDTLQGCNQPIVSIYGETVNLKAQVKRDPLVIGTAEFESQVNDVESRMLHTQMRTELLASVDVQEQSSHLEAFEMYRLCCQLNMGLYVRKLSPFDPEIQTLREKTLRVVGYLLNTQFKVIICLPLLLCGMCTITDVDKGKLHKSFQKIMQASPVLNVASCWTIVQASWSLNPTGEMVIDWTDICDQFNWHLNVC